jgi:hypothetical protein
MTPMNRHAQTPFPGFDAAFGGASVVGRAVRRIIP